MDVPLDAQRTDAPQNGTEDEVDTAVDHLIQTAMEAFSEGISFQEITHNAVEEKRKSRWTFQSALYFSTTILTSVGECIRTNQFTTWAHFVP